MEEKTYLRIIKTRKALCDAFLVLLSEKRFEDITVGELCDRAMVRRATFYKHYADKYEFFSFFIRQYEETFSLDAKEHQKDSLPDYSSFMFGKCIQFLREHHEIVQSMLNSNMLPVMLDLFTEEIYRNTLFHIEENKQLLSALSVAPETLAAFYAGGIMQVTRQWIMSKPQRSVESLSEDFSRILHSFSEDALTG